MDLKAMRLQVPILWSSVQTDFQEYRVFSQVPPDKSIDELLLIMIYPETKFRNKIFKKLDKEKMN